MKCHQTATHMCMSSYGSTQREYVMHVGTDEVFALAKQARVLINGHPGLDIEQPYSCMWFILIFPVNIQH